MDNNEILEKIEKLLQEFESSRKGNAEELELTIQMQKGIIKDLEKRLAEEKALCAEWRKRALIAERELKRCERQAAATTPQGPDGREKKSNSVSYDKETDYTLLIREAAERGDYRAAALYEQQRNAKIDGEDLEYSKTDDFAAFLPNRKEV